jgi:putative proteasome-type protease
MTYCVGALLDDGLVMASDSRTNAGLDNVSKFCKMKVFERAGDRVLALLSSGNLAGTQAVINVLRQRSEDTAGPTNLWTVRTMFDVALLVSDVMRDIERRDAPHLEGGPISFNASFILGGQIKGEAPRLFRIYAEGNFIEAGEETPFLQTGEAKYGKPILDRVISRSTKLADATKCVLVSFDSTMRSNLSVGMPIDLLCYERDSLELRMRQRFDIGDPYFSSLSSQWSLGVRKVFREVPDLDWFSRTSPAAPRSAAAAPPANPRPHARPIDDDPPVPGEGAPPSAGAGPPT